MYYLKMWFALLIAGLLFYPWVSKLFEKFYDKGWLFSKIIAVGVTGIVVWLLAYIKIMPFGQITCYLVLLFFGILNFIYFRKKNKSFKINYDLLERILISEIIFCISFIAWTLVRSYNVPINNQTEQFMNYGFMNKISNSDYFPVEDIWFSGNCINYYYFGQYIAAFIVKIAFLNVKEGYGMMLALVASLTFTLPFSLVFNLIKNLFKDKLKIRYVMIIGILAGLIVSLAGTLYYPIYRWIVPREPGDTYHYWEAVRFIGYRPETNDKTITDIPAYSNIAQDLHAHYSDTMFVFVMLALLLAFLLKDKKDSNKKRMFNCEILILGIILAIQKMTNYWDFPIYLVVLSIIIFVNNVLKYKFDLYNFILSFVQILEVVFVEELVSLPFSRDLYISATHVYLTHVTSPFYKWAVLWALPTICVFYNVAIWLKRILKKSNEKLMDKLRKINLTEVYVVLIGLCAVGLVIMPEIIYLKDIYGDEYKRANTMFKLTYEGFIMFSISTSFIVTKFIVEKGKVVKKIIAGLLLLLQLTTLGYGIEAIKYQVETYKQPKDFSKVEDYIKQVYPDDYEAIQWINENIDKDSVFVELVTGSYRPAGRISVFTGNPVVLAWHEHEWIWRATEDYKCPQEESNRWIDVQMLYTAKSPETIKEYVERYNISYIYYGELESETYKDISALKEYGEVVYEKTEGYHRVPVCIIKVK